MLMFHIWKTQIHSSKTAYKHIILKQHTPIINGKWKSLSGAWLFGTPRTVTHQAPLFLVILQARIMEKAAITSSRECSQPRNWTQVFWLSHQGSPLLLIPCSHLWIRVKLKRHTTLKTTSLGYVFRRIQFHYFPGRSGMWAWLLEHCGGQGALFNDRVSFSVTC